VHIQAKDFDLLWEKGDSVNRYVFNGSEYTVAGRGTPEFLESAFGPVKLGTNKEVLQVSDQFHPIFILDQSGTVVADVLSDVAKLDQINTAMRLVEKDRKSTASLRKVREQDVRDLRISLETYEGLDEVVSRVGSVEDLGRQAYEAEVEVERLDRYLGILLSVAKCVKDLSSVESVEVPEISALQSSGETYLSLRSFAEALAGKTRGVEALSKVEEIAVPSPASSTLLEEKYRTLAAWSMRLRFLKAFFERMQKSQDVEAPALDPLGAAESKYGRLSAWEQCLLRMLQIVNRLEGELSAAERDADEALREFGVLGVCPTCNRALYEAHEHV
jgi:hypothetical protein